MRVVRLDRRPLASIGRVMAVVGVSLGLAAAALPVGLRLYGGGTDPGLRVAHPRMAPPALVDQHGRTVNLRGVAVTALVQYATDYHENPPVRDADFAEMAALGFDFVRLPVSWSAIEPTPGSIDTGYVTRAAGVVRAAERHGLRVLIDMHVDRYGTRLTPGEESDGAPPWATLVPPSCPDHPSVADCTRTAWQRFWSDRSVHGRGLQEHYVDALLALSRRLRDQPGVAGIELMNNPSSGGTPSPAFELRQVWPFYRRAIRALRDDGEKRPLWIDRAASAETSDALPRALLARLSPDSNLVLAPHDYSGVFSSPAWPADGASRVTQWYRNAIRQAAALRMAVVIGEWGSAAGSPWESLLSTKLGLQDAAGVGSSFWMWKQRPGFYNWYLVNLDGSLRGDSSRAQLLSRPHVDAVPGRLLTSTFGSGRLTVRVTGPGGSASLWSGTQVQQGGQSMLAAPLTHASADGHSVPTSVEPRSFRTSRVALLGYLVTVRVPPGTHTLVLS